MASARTRLDSNRLTGRYRLSSSAAAINRKNIAVNGAIGTHLRLELID